MLPKDHPLATSAGKTIKAADLLSYDLIIPSRASRLDEINEWFKDVDGTPTIRCRMAHMINAYELVRHGVGISIYPASAGNYSGKDVRIKEIIHPPVQASYVVIWNKNHRLSHVAEEFIKYIKSTL